MNVSALVRNEAVLADLEEKFPAGHFFPGDVVSASATRAWFDSAEKRFGRIDGLINNAAVTGPGGKLGEISFEEFRDCLEINLLAPIRLCQEILPRFFSEGFIINLSGGGATGPRPNFSAYGVSKTAIVRFTENLALEYPEHAIYALAPGFLKTPMIEKVLGMDRKKIEKDHDEANRRWKQGGDDPKRAGDLALRLFRERPAHLRGRLISATYDNYALDFASVPESWWTLRRVDEVVVKQLDELK